MSVVVLRANEKAEPFAPPSFQKFQHYYNSVRHSATHQFSKRYFESQLIGRLFAHRNSSFSRSLKEPV